MNMRHFFHLTALAFGLTMATSGVAQVAVGFGGVAHDATQPVEVTSDSLSIDQTSGNAVFEGDVIVIQGELRMAAARIEVIYSETDGARTVQDVIATGGVLVTRGPDAAEGEEALYDVPSSILTMTGDVLVTQGATVISGDEMVVDMTTGMGTVDGRVRTILTPDSGQ
jgi:lipopolysaccharide export system protein LptA